MEGQQLPKATMNSFVKKHTDLHGNPDFLNKLLILSKEFIVRLADKSNEICELNNKKTINAEHLEAALEKFGLAHHNDQLKKLGSDIKEINELKREASKRLEENIEREKREQRERRLLEEPEKKQVTVREKFDQFDKEKEEKDEEEDYEQLAKIDEAEEQHPVDSFMMMNTQEVVILYPRENKIYVFNLPQKKYYQYNHQFMNQESDLSQIYGFSETMTICVKEKGKHHDHRLYLTYYQYPMKSDTKSLCKYQSIDNQWTTDMLIFKGNNHSMVIWCKQRNDEEIDIRMFHRSAQPQGTYKQYKFKNQLVIYYNMSKIETSISYAFELRQNNILLICFTNKSDCRVINKDGVVNNNFILNTQVPQAPFLRESKFYFQKDFNHYLIDYRNFGSYSMFRTYDYKNRVAQLSPIYYVDNMNEQIVCKEYWRCSYLHKYFVPGYTNNGFVQAMHQNGHVDNFIVHCKRILNPSVGVNDLLQEIKLKLDENLLTDVYDLLQGQ